MNEFAQNQLFEHLHESFFIPVSPDPESRKYVVEVIYVEFTSRNCRSWSKNFHLVSSSRRFWHVRLDPGTMFTGFRPEELLKLVVCT